MSWRKLFQKSRPKEPNRKEARRRERRALERKKAFSDRVKMDNLHTRALREYYKHRQGGASE